jgi:hypothetical protein
MVNRPILIRSATKPELEGIIAFILISWGSGSPHLNTDPDKSLFRERASHAVRLFLSHCAVILATQIWTGLPPARNRYRAVVRSVCAIRLLRTAGGASRLNYKIPTRAANFVDSPNASSRSVMFLITSPKNECTLASQLMEGLVRTTSRKKENDSTIQFRSRFSPLGQGESENF